MVQISLYYILNDYLTVLKKKFYCESENWAAHHVNHYRAVIFRDFIAPKNEISFSRMIGYLVISASDQVLLAAGDESFQEHLFGQLPSQAHPEVPSTSSGFSSSCVVTDSASETAPSSSTHMTRAPVPNAALPRCRITELAEVTHVFLPLISIYRASLYNKSTLERISFNAMAINFANINPSSQIMSISDW